MYNGVVPDNGWQRVKKMAELKLTFWQLYDILTGVIGGASLAFVEMSAIQGAITTFVFVCFALVRIILMWEDVKKKRLDNKEKKYFVDKKIDGGIGVVVKDRNDQTANDIILTLEYFHAIKGNVDRMFDSTKADRFLIMKAVNGTIDFKSASVLYEQHKKTANTKKSMEAAGKYVDFDFDTHCNQTLKDAEKQSVVDMPVEKLPDGTDLKNIYLSEGVTHSRLYFIRRIKVTKDKDVLLYVSVATHEGFFTDVEKIIMKQCIATIKASTNEISV